MATPGTAVGDSADDGDGPPEASALAPTEPSVEEIASGGLEPVLIGRSAPRRRAAIVAALVVLMVATGVFAYLSGHNDSVANRYHHLDVAEIALVHRLDQQVAAANSEIKNLNAQLTATQGHLATVANQKAKELDLLKEAGLVAADQNSCINRVQILGADVASSLQSGQPSPQVVQSDADRVATVCEQAQQATQALQATVNGQP